jgi:poly-gamma-glutamate capsule biosynthesis protein CapA/YwtB (metallophosphatase superfamily)
MRCRLIALWLALAACDGAEPGVLPIYIEENHGGSFGWFAERVNLEEPHVLVLIDAHSDATSVSHSDSIREGLRRVGSEEERRERVEQWRRRGRVQAFNWIEPLMPRPIERVVWLPSWEIGKGETAQFLESAARSLDGRTDFEHRDAGEMGSRWQVLPGSSFSRWQPGNLPVLATIDLDFFAGMPPDLARERFEKLWHRLPQLPRLSSVTFAISRAWLTDDAEAFRLLLLVLEEVRLVRGAKVSFEPFAPRGPDESLRALDFPQGKAPTFSIDNAPADLRAFLALRGASLSVSTETSRWEELCQRWRESADFPTIQPDRGSRSTDGGYRVPASELPALRLQASKITGHAKWYALVSAAPCYNLLPGIDLGKGFVPNASPWVRDRRVFLAETFDGALASASWRPILDKTTGWGRARIEADVETDDGTWMPTDTVELRVTEGAGFRAALTEQFGMPYVFGAGFFSDSALDGPDTGIGNDCANFLVAAWRRAGRSLPWGNPAQLRQKLRTIEEHADRVRARFGPSDVENGIAIDFGTHMAALWQDREPLGVLDDNDLVIHHLGGFPERTTLRALAKKRPHYAARTLPREIACRVAIGGDVVLAGTEDSDVVRIAEHVRDADLVVVNLEGIPANPGAAPARSRYRFSFSPERLALLRQAGISSVGLANNHAGDAGREGIIDALKALKDTGLPAFGIGDNPLAAVAPWRVECRGARLAFFAISCVDAMTAEPNAAGVASLPQHESDLEEAMAQVKSDGYTIIVLAHWGREYAHFPDDEQRRWARWLIDRGADLVAGSHPHVIQPLDAWRGRSIANSLGNALFPKELRGTDSGAWLEVAVDQQGRIIHLEQVPIAQIAR